MYFLITVFHGALVRDDIIKASLLMFPALGCGTAIVSWECVCEGDVDGFVFSGFRCQMDLTPAMVYVIT